ncbi:hypothetical protein RHSIM_Rhsim01G0060400 [Rhododendron simsii]|uniref:Uncharacterized protein n=1 Tax=Rhododendron simsii TaxID=118357 RepID=A0A834HHX0_RHOSS|nr:hypothetical protein RHSIM_Rhsim01G0060400 [Rhododendron simsii]
MNLVYTSALVLFFHRLIEDNYPLKAAFSPDPVTKAHTEEEPIARKSHEESARIRAQRANKVASATQRRPEEATVGRESRMVVVAGQSGQLEDVAIMSSRKRVFAIIAMPSKDAAVAAATGPLKHVEPEGTKPSNLLGVEYQLFEDSVWEKNDTEGSEPSHLQMPSLLPSES